MKTWIATDIGGTFTDIVVCTVDDDHRTVDISFGKVASTPPDFETGVIEAMGKSQPADVAVERFVHGSTIVINAITERKGARVGLITTRGFRDVLEIGRGNRPDMFNINYVKPRPLVPRHLRMEIDERITADGRVAAPLDVAALPSIMEHLRQHDVRAVAICLLHSYANPVHEIEIANYLSKAHPDISVIASHAVCRQWREYERTSTAVLSAFVKPVIESYIGRILARVASRQVDDESSFAMLSNGGLTRLRNTPNHPLSMIESGPAAGVIAAQAVGRSIGRPNLISIDVGGTTAKCALIEQGRFTIADEYHVERTPIFPGYPVMTPVIDIVEIGNGGGSIIRVDEGRKLQIGPESAGAVPGPICYGKGGKLPTLTDAMILLGVIDPSQVLGSGGRTDVPEIRSAFAGLGQQLGMAAVEVALACFRLATVSIVNAIKLISINRGHDPREFSLIAYGGGGGFYGAFLARELGISEVIVPRGQEVFSAWGMLVADLRRDYVQTSMTEIAPSTFDRIEQGFANMEAAATAEFQSQERIGAQLSLRRYGEMRYDTQEFTVLVPWPDDQGPADNAQAAVGRFNDAHKKRYGFSLKNSVQVVSLKVVCEGILQKLSPRRMAPEPGAAPLREASRMIHVEDAGPVRARVLARERLSPGTHVEGPAILESDSSCIIVPSGAVSTIDDFGNVILCTIRPKKLSGGKPMSARDQIAKEVMQKSLQAISDEMFAVLKHTAHGLVIYEMLDFCVAVTDESGRLVVQGNGLPFFIATLEPAVREVIRKFGRAQISDGDVFILNDPYAGGGTHLKDVCLVRPVFFRNELIAFVANKGHWSEMGGKDPTVSTDSTEIWQEGLQLPTIKLYERGKLNQAVYEMIAANVRLPEETTGDMEAGLAALTIGEHRLTRLAERYGVVALREAIEDLLDYAERLSIAGLAKLPKGRFSAEDWIDDDGITDDPIRVMCTIEITNESFAADFTGTSGEVRGPFNCGRNGLEFAVNMVFKALTSPSAPANHGGFRPVRIACPDRTVLTAQRPAPTGRYHQPAMIAVEAMLRALSGPCPGLIPAGNLASACGANIVGTRPGSNRMYVMIEPLIGGWGAGRERDGQNGLFYYACGETRNIPIEIQEAKYGLRVIRYAFHSDDGGEGKQRGGKGITLEYLVEEKPVYLTGDFGRHKFGPWSVAGGREGSRSSAKIVRRSGSVETYHRPSMVRVDPGERIILTTATGGGFGDPQQRDHGAIRDDLLNGFITEEQARSYYGFLV